MPKGGIGFQSAIQHLTVVIELDPENPSNEKAYYNRACYHALLGDKARALDDLKESIKLFQENADFALTDEDFDGISDSREFNMTVGPE